MTRPLSTVPELVAMVKTVINEDNTIANSKIAEMIVFEIAELRVSGGEILSKSVMAFNPVIVDQNSLLTD